MSDSPRFALVTNDFNHTASAMTLPIGAGLALFFTNRPPGLWRLWPLVGAGLALVTVAESVSRGGLIGALVCIVVVVVRSSRRPLLALAGLAAIAAPAAVAAAGRVQAGSTGRLSIYRIALESCAERCWTGSGLSTFPVLHSEVSVAAPELGRTLLERQSHNLWIGMSVEMGIPVAVLWSLSFVAPFIMARRIQHGIGTALLGALMGLFATNLFLDGWEFKYFWLPIALAAIGWNAERVVPSTDAPEQKELVA